MSPPPPPFGLLWLPQDDITADAAAVQQIYQTAALKRMQFVTEQLGEALVSPRGEAASPATESKIQRLHDRLQKGVDQLLPPQSYTLNAEKDDVGKRVAVQALAEQFRSLADAQTPDAVAMTIADTKLHTALRKAESVVKHGSGPGPLCPPACAPDRRILVQPLPVQPLAKRKRTPFF